MKVIVLKEQSRKCGFRHSGKDGVGLYLMGEGIMEICERLPFPLEVCPCCGEGIKFSRGYTWVNPRKLFAQNRGKGCDIIPRFPSRHAHEMCFMCSPPDGQHGLLWVGNKTYSPGTFCEEAAYRGISRRIASVPRGFEFGKTVVYLAHINAMPKDEAHEGKPWPGVFTSFRPTHLDLVVDTTNVDELPSKALFLAKKFGDNARLVKVEKIEQLNLL